MSKVNSLFKSELCVVNVGLELFTEVLDEIKVSYIQVDWRPPASGDQELLNLLSLMNEMG